MRPTQQEDTTLKPLSESGWPDEFACPCCGDLDTYWKTPAGVFAHAQAEVVAHNIAVAITGHDAPERFDGAGSCHVEMGDGVAAYAKGNFYAVPAPAVAMRSPNRLWHWGKIYVEKWWLRRWF